MTKDTVCMHVGQKEKFDALGIRTCKGSNAVCMSRRWCWMRGRAASNPELPKQSNRSPRHRPHTASWDHVDELEDELPARLLMIAGTVKGFLVITPRRKHAGLYMEMLRSESWHSISYCCGWVGGGVSRGPNPLLQAQLGGLRMVPVPWLTSSKPVQMSWSPSTHPPHTRKRNPL